MSTGNSKSIGEFMSNSYVDILYKELKRMVLQGKNYGAGGGGFLMVYVPKKNNLEFKKYLKKKLDILNWNFYPKGSEIIFADDQ